MAVRKVLIGCICYISLLCNANAGVLDCQFDTFVGLDEDHEEIFDVKDSSVEGLADDIFSGTYTFGTASSWKQVFEGTSDAWFSSVPDGEIFYDMQPDVVSTMSLRFGDFSTQAEVTTMGELVFKFDTPEIASYEQDRITYRRTPEQMIEAIHKGLEVPMYLVGYEIENGEFASFLGRGWCTVR